MAYITGDRKQTVLFPPSVEDYIPVDDPVRAYDAFVEQLDLHELGIVIDHNQLGPPEFDPRVMLKIFVYGTAYGIRTSRKLERACRHNLSFIWLTGNLKPDHMTLCRFRRNFRESLAQVLKQCVRLCLRLKLVEGNTLFVDGTKIKANASVDHSWNEERCQKLLKHADQKIMQILSEMEKLDQEDEHKESLVQMEKDLHNKKALKERVASILNDLKNENKESLNTTDPECAKVKDKQTFTAGYNMQAVTDDKHGLIIHTDVFPEANDSQQFSNQVDQANNNIGGTCKIACADAGYSNTKIQKEIDDKNILVVVPSQRQALKEPSGPFSKDKFVYDPHRHMDLSSRQITGPCWMRRVRSAVPHEKQSRLFILHSLWPVHLNRERGRILWAGSFFKTTKTVSKINTSRIVIFFKGERKKPSIRLVTSKEIWAFNLFFLED